MRLGLVATLTVLLTSGLEAQERPRSSWTIRAGAVTLLLPRYPGSDEHRLLPFPLLDVWFRDRVFLGPSTTGMGYALGVYGIRTRRLGLSFEAGGQDSRPASRADALAGLDDRDGVFTLGASLTWRAGLFEAGVAATRGINDGAGSLARARLSYSRFLGPLLISASTTVAVADSRQMGREFGVSETEASRRRALIDAGDDRLRPGDGRAYDPDAGLRHVGGSVSMLYLLSRRWSLLGFGNVERFGDKPAGSPLVRRREQLTVGLGISYQL